MEAVAPPGVEAVAQPQEEAGGEPLADEMPAEGSAAPPRRRLARLLAFLRGQEPSAEASGLAEEVAPPAAYAAALPAVVAVDPPAVVAVDPPAVEALDVTARSRGAAGGR